MSESVVCQLCFEGCEVLFIARCGHKFHEKCLKKWKRSKYRCTICGIKFFKSKDLEKVLFNALEQNSPFYDEIFTLFEHIEDKKYAQIEFNETALKEAINLGFDLSSLNETLILMLTLICNEDSVRKLNILMDLGLKLKPDEKIGVFFWDMALKNESLYILEIMKGLGFDPKAVHPSYAIKNRVTRWLFKNGFDLNTKIDGCYQIHLAVLHEDLELVKFLLRKGADINIKDNKGLSPFHKFVQELSETYKQSYFFMVDLIDLGADIESANDKDETPLYFALKNKKTYLISFLLSKKANVNNPKVKEFGSILFYVLSYERRTFGLENFLSKYPNIHEKDSQGQNVLHKLMGAKIHDYSIVKLVTGRGVSINAQDEEGNTPLHILGSTFEKSSYNMESIKNMLFNLSCNGANLNLKNKKGESAITTFIRMRGS